MPKLSQLQAPREFVVRLYGEEIKGRYKPAFITEDYIDKYVQYMAKFRQIDADESIMSSERMVDLREFVARQLDWIDLQFDDGTTPTPSPEALKKLGLIWDDLIAINLAINFDVRRRERNADAAKAEERAE